ncbi:MAG: DMT family transporter [Butyrivibrio sp.]
MKKTETKGKKSAMSIVLLVTAAIIWGSSFVVVKDSLDYITPIWQLALRFSVAAVPAVVLAIIRRKQWNKKTVVRSLVLGVIFFLAVLFQNLGANLSSASKASFLTGTYVAFFPVVELIFIRRKITLKKGLSAFICLCGTGVLTIEKGLRFQTGDIFLLLCGIMYAVHLMYIDISDCDGVLLHSGQIITAAVLAVITALIFEPVPAHVNLRCMLGIVYCGIFEVFLGFFFQLVGQKNTNPSLAAIILSMESLFGLIFSVIFLGDVMSPRIIIGGLLIVFAAIFNGV